MTIHAVVSRRRCSSPSDGGVEVVVFCGGLDGVRRGGLHTLYLMMFATSVGVGCGDVIGDGAARGDGAVVVVRVRGRGLGLTG